MMSPESIVKYKESYRAMFLAVQSGDVATANHYRVLMEEIRQSYFLSRVKPDADLESLPDFVKVSLNKVQKDLGVSEASNCVNAVFNFHSLVPTYKPYSP